MRSRLTHKFETLRSDIRAGANASALPTSPPPDLQAVPPDTPTTLDSAPPDSPPPLVTPPPTPPQSGSQYDEVWAEIPESWLSGLEMTPPDTDQLLQYPSEECPVNDPIESAHQSVPYRDRHGKGISWDGIGNLPRGPSFPDSPAPTIPDTPDPDPTSYAYPCAYPASYTPTLRDHACDVAACMTAVHDLNGLTRHIVSNREFSNQTPDPTGVATTREDVVESLSILKYMVDRLFSRLS